MIVLDSTLKSLTVAMSAAPATTNPDFVVAWSDDTGSAFTEGSTDGALNGTTQVTMVAAPAASTRRLVKTIYIENKDTAPITIIVTLNNNGTLRTISRTTLAVGDSWTTDGVTDTNGNFKTIGLSGISGISGYSGYSGYSGSGISGYSGYSGSGISGFSGFSGISGFSGYSGTIGTTTGTGSVVLQTNPSITNPTITNYVETLYTANTSTAITVDLTNGTVQKLTLTANATITMPTAAAGKSFIVMLKQDATGSRTVTWSTVSWPSSTAPTITSTANKQDMYSFFSDGTNWYGVTVGQNF